MNKCLVPCNLFTMTAEALPPEATKIKIRDGTNRRVAALIRAVVMVLLPAVLL